jgi:hypothetical protein
MRLDQAGHPGAHTALELGVLLERLGRQAALPGDLEVVAQRCLGILDLAAHVVVVRVHPQLAPRALDDRRGLPVVVRVRVGDDEQPHVLEAQVALVHRALELLDRARLVHAAVEEDDAVAGGDGPGVAVRHAGEREREAEAPDAGHDTLAAGQLTPA